MKNLSSRIMFSAEKQNEKSVQIKKWHGTDCYNQLCNYCAVYDIDLTKTSDRSFNAAVKKLNCYLIEAIKDKSTNTFYFWVN